MIMNLRDTIITLLILLHITSAYSSKHIGLYENFHEEKNLPLEKSYTNG